MLQERPRRPGGGHAAAFERHSLGRLGTTEDIAYGALYLASDESSFVTGQSWSLTVVLSPGRAHRSFFCHPVRYNYVRTACAIPIPSSARRIGVRGVAMTFEEILDQAIAMLGGADA